MIEQFRLPRLDQGMEEGTVVAWLVAPGEEVTAGTSIIEIETDKVTTELEAPHDGQVLRIDVEAGQRVPVGTVLGWFGDGSKEPPATVDGSEGGATGGQTATPVDDGSGTANGTSGAPMGPILKPSENAASTEEAERKHTLPRDRTAWQRPHQESPRVRSDALLSKERRDASHETAEDGHLTLLTPMRQAVVATVTRSWQIPQFDLTVDVDITDATAILRDWRDGAEPPYVGVTDLLLASMARAVPSVPDVNAWFEEDGIRRFGQVNITLLVQTGDGLVMPRIRSVEGRRLGELRDERRRLVAAAGAGRLSAEDISTGTIALSNLGGYSVDRFNALLIPPQVAILAVGRARLDAAGRRQLGLTLTVDHRAVDGAAGAQYLGATADLLSDPTRLLL